MSAADSNMVCYFIPDRRLFILKSSMRPGHSKLPLLWTLCYCIDLFIGLLVCLPAQFVRQLYMNYHEIYASASTPLDNRQSIPILGRSESRSGNEDFHFV